jgi:hypothetical protein
MGNGTNIRTRQRGGNWVGGLVLIVIGTLFLLDNLGFIDIGEWAPYWPFLIACVGAGRIIEARTPADVSRGGFMIFVGFWLYACLEHVWDLGFYNSWPMILIALGLRQIFAGLSASSEKNNDRTPS